MSGTATPTTNPLATIVRAQRSRLGRTVEDVAKQANMTVELLTLVERGERIPSTGVLLDLARAVNLSASTLLAASGRLDPKTHAFIEEHPRILLLLRAIKGGDFDAAQRHLDTLRDTL